jgi:hypothetical protein
LHESALRLGWHWHEAPILAVLDLFTILQPISESDFVTYLSQITEDPLGPFGKVLLNSPHFLFSKAANRTAISKQKTAGDQKPDQQRLEFVSNHTTGRDMISLLKEIAPFGAANKYKKFLNKTDINTFRVPADKAALLIIDPQRSFTKGVWMKSIGFEAEIEVQPIQLAFAKCAQFLHENYGFIETMFTRCPFPPGSYDWDDTLTGIIDNKQLYFIKPGNSVLFPPINGFREWVERFIDDGKDILVLAGCTLNSCVRVSAIETQKYFKDHELQIVVDLSMSGARTSNFVSSELFGGLSAVESAIREMTHAGVRVAQSVVWV